MIWAAAGYAGTTLALAGSLALTIFAWRAARRPPTARRAPLRRAVTLMVVGAAVSMGSLELALVTDSFAVSYVAQNSSRATPLIFKVTAGWSALAGSIVLWSVVLAGFTAGVLRQVRSADDRLGTGALAVMGAVAAFFFGLVSTVANPFGVLSPVPLDGPGPNALLQNHLMVAIHPPLLYIGYVGFTVPFAFALSALAQRQAGVEWLRRTRRANLVAWTFLSAGLGVGAWWSYEVLGWGGFWAWDPVENAALLPWLVGTAFIHSAVVQVRRGLLQSWNIVLVLTTFGLTLLGTFLTRSSVVVSVHSFTTSSVAPALLGFFVASMVVGFGLFALRGSALASTGRLESLASREGAFLVNNLLLTLLAFVTLLGTLYPVFVEAVSGSQLSVGRPFFDRMAVPIGFALLLTMGIGPFAPYRAASGRVVWSRLRLPLLLGAAAAAGLVLAGLRSAPIVLLVLLGVVVAAGSARQLLTTAPDRRPRSLLRLVRGRRGYWGGQLAHVGVVVVALAIAVSAGLSDRTSVTLRAGQSVDFAGYSLTWAGTTGTDRGFRREQTARIELRRDGALVQVLAPRLNQYPSQQQAVASPAVWTTAQQDVYVALSALEPDRISVNLWRYPMMWALWAGGAIVVAGGLWALGGRTRRPAEPEPTPAGPAAGTPEPDRTPEPATEHDPAAEPSQVPVRA